ncbi:MAG: sigma-70 family RNA polymerase sigma factor [Deltaproteobacteria bacterium]|nr:sigma-70 family RNA polymerase sigma factor [Deltaproteobacteria bacterium]MBW2383703.1 sigma-70 family RNA polymerase sigma factor [Deltaproteobacteria bacterium]MBW2696636.1 sigma-70 family RNA polymerase sigma factor [Deltaproteobacteria bacterium]
MEAAEQQLDILARRYEHRVVFFANKVRRSFMLGPGWSDDLISAGYWGLFKALRNRRPDAHEKELSAYVSKRIHGAVMDAARTELSQLRHRELRSSFSEDDDGHPVSTLEAIAAHRIQDPGAGPEALAVAVWRRTAIGNALTSLEPAERRVVLAYMEGASIGEIARDEGVPTGTLQARFRKLTRRLRAKFPELRRILLDAEPS